MADIKNGRCFAQEAQSEPPLIQHGTLVLAAHDIGWIVTGCCTFVALVLSFWLVEKHLRWYTDKLEQRYILRILLMVPIYAAVSFASYLFWNHSTALLLIRDCYEAIVLTSFFYLILNYLSHDPEEQKDIFRKVGLSRENDREARRRGAPLAHWVFPLQSVGWKPEDGLYFLQLMKWGVLQYCVIRPLTTLAAVILNYIGLYCDDSWSPGWGHLYITIIMSISVTIAMYCLIQLYMPIAGHLAPHKPLLKLFAVKAVVFLTFWQETLISGLEDVGVIKNTTYMTADNIATGASAILETFEMVLFALLHIRAYTYKPYRGPGHRPARWRALRHALDFTETLREVWCGIVYMAHRARGRETDVHARREAAMENVFGKSRYAIREHARVVSEKAYEGIGHGDGNTPHGAEGQWLGRGDDDAYVYGKNESGFNLQVESGVGKKGSGRRGGSKEPSRGIAYARIEATDSPQVVSSHRREPSWWKHVYSRLSRADDGTDNHRLLSQDPRASALLAHEYDYDDAPPPSLIQTYRSHRLPAIPSSAVPPQPQSSEVIPAIATSTLLHMQDSVPAEPGLLLSPTSLMSDSTSLASSVPTSARRSDSFLHRAFADLPPSSSTEGLSSGPSSSQSHRTQIRLITEPRVLTREMAPARTPFVNYPLAFPASAIVSHIDANATAPPAPIRHSYSQGQPMPMSMPMRGRHAPQESRRHSTPQVHIAPAPAASSDAAPASRRRDSAPFRPRFTPRRDQIVLPVPLAPATNTQGGDQYIGRTASSTSHPSQPYPHALGRNLDQPLSALYPSRPPGMDLPSRSHPAPHRSRLDRVTEV